MKHICLLWVVMLSAGCGGVDPRSRAFEVSGTVTWEVQSVPEGDITLVSDDTTLAADVGTIKNGEFRVLASAGHKRVKIRASRDVLAHITKPHDPKYEEYIPEKFNEKTELTMDVVPGGKNYFEFRLSSK